MRSKGMLIHLSVALAGLLLFGIYAYNSAIDPRAYPYNIGDAFYARTGVVAAWLLASVLYAHLLRTKREFSWKHLLFGAFAGGWILLVFALSFLDIHRPSANAEMLQHICTYLTFGLVAGLFSAYTRKMLTALLLGVSVFLMQVVVDVVCIGLSLYGPIQLMSC